MGARSAVGVSSLPLNISVEVEVGRRAHNYVHMTTLPDMCTQSPCLSIMCNFARIAVSYSGPGRAGPGRADGPWQLEWHHFSV
jgi:hypothetical protein